MEFLTLPDFDGSIDRDQLRRLCGGGPLDQAPATDILARVDAEAVELMMGYLAARYDVEAIFQGIAEPPEPEEDEEPEEPVDARNPIIVRHCTNIAIYLLSQRLPVDQVPETRVYYYEAARKWLEGVQALKINPPDLPKVPSPEGDTKDYVQWGSNRRRSTHLN